MVGTILKRAGNTKKRGGGMNNNLEENRQPINARKCD